MFKMILKYIYLLALKSLQLKLSIKFLSGARGVMVIVVGIGHEDASSNLARD